jgi:hypothetical protein
MTIPKTKVGIIVICTGRYFTFLNELVLSARKNLLNDCDLSFFVFTDSVPNINGDDIKHFHQEKLGWPYDTLLRNHTFLKQKDELSKMDYLFFWNANMSVRTKVGRELFPKESDNYLCAVIHPSYWWRKKKPFEPNPDSSAYIQNPKGCKYYQGCFYGGKTQEFLAMAEEIKTQIDIDLTKGLIAVWWDESHLNKYFSKIKPKGLSPAYAYPEDWFIPFPKKIVQLNKTKHGGHEFLRK